MLVNVIKVEIINGLSVNLNVMNLNGVFGDVNNLFVLFDFNEELLMV